MGHRHPLMLRGGLEPGKDIGVERYANGNLLHEGL